METMTMETMAKETAINMVRANEGAAYDFADHSLEPEWDIEGFVNYLQGCEKCESSDYPLILNEIRERIDSCGFPEEIVDDIYMAFFDKADLLYINGDF